MQAYGIILFVYYSKYVHEYKRHDGAMAWRVRALP